MEHKGYNYFIWLPEELSSIFPQKGNIPVRGTVNNCRFKGYLAPRKPNRHVLYLHSEIRQQTGIQIGDRVKAAIEFDPESRNVPIPEDVEWILKEHERNWEAFMQLTQKRRNEMIKYILEAKRTDTRLRRIEYLIKRLMEYPVKKNS
jgi:hypothetical protein